MTSTYHDFLTSKRRDWSGSGRDVPEDVLPSPLYPFQRALTRWALRKGRAAMFADTGLGKTFMQLAWAAQVPGRVLILAPLCVGMQTVREAQKLDLIVGALGSGERIEITNYERLHQVDAAQYAGVVLDESSILKAFDGKTRTALIQAFQAVPFRLCCTATPAPNDIAELANHCEFLGLMTRTEMLATFFVHDEDGWRLKGHAHEAFYRWLASWGMFLRRPSDLGFSDAGYVLPPLEVTDLAVGDGSPSGGVLFPEMGLGGIRERLSARRESVSARVDATVALVQADREQWIVWCGLNDEQDAVTTALGTAAVSIAGADAPEVKAARLEAFLDGRARVLVTKVRIAGFGLNLQQCHRMAFLGLGDSYESYYQAIRRCWRFGQQTAVQVHVVVSVAERAIVRNVRRKETEAAQLAERLVSAMRAAEREEIGVSTRTREAYRPTVQMHVPDWLARWSA